jgi:hypothetical protein
MSDDETDESRPDAESEPERGSETESDEGADAGTEVPISTGENGSDEDDVDETPEDGVEIEVETGSPGPDVERRADADNGADPGGSGAGGLFNRLDETLVDLLSRGLGTETHVRVYLAVRRRPWSTPEQVAAEAGLYPRAVRDALSTLEASGAVERRGPAGESGSRTAGEGHTEEGENGPSEESEYAAVGPSAVLTDAIEAVGGTGDGLPDGLDLDRYLGAEPASDDSPPVRIDTGDVSDTDAESDEATDSGTTDDGTTDSGTTGDEPSDDTVAEDGNGSDGHGNGAGEN